MWEQLKRRSSYQALPTIEPKKDVYRDLHHPVFQSIRVLQVRQFFIQLFLQHFLTFLRTLSILCTTLLLDVVILLQKVV